MSVKRKIVVAAAIAAVVLTAAFVTTGNPEGPGTSAEPATSAETGAQRANRARERPRVPRPAVPSEELVPLVPPPVDLATVDRDLDLHGVVVQRDGTPISGASVSAVTALWARAMLLNFEEHHTESVGPATESTADGTFRIRLARGQDVTLRVKAAGFATVDLPHRLAPPVRGSRAARVCDVEADRILDR